MKPDEIIFKKNSIVYFDLCDTLYHTNTTMSFLDFYFKENLHYKVFRTISKFFVVKAINLFSIRLFKYDLIRSTAISYLKNQKTCTVQESLPNYYSWLISKKTYISHLLLQNAKDASCKIFLVSASLDFIVEFVAKELGLYGFYATKLNRDNNIFNGKINTDLLGNKKQVFREINSDNRSSYFITDNLSDINCIDYVDYFIVITKHKNLNFWKKQKNICKIYEI